MGGRHLYAKVCYTHNKSICRRKMFNLIFIIIFPSCFCISITKLDEREFTKYSKTYENKWLKPDKHEMHKESIDSKNIEPPTCGITFSGDRIINGQKAAKNEFPWMAQLREINNLYEPKSYSKLFCGGSILNGKWILSAAHCFITNDPYSVLKISRNANGFYSKFRIAIGVQEVNQFETQSFYGYEITTKNKIRGEIDNKDKQLGSGVFQVKKIIIHGNYSFEYLTNDISLIELAHGIYWDEYQDMGRTNIRPVCLPDMLSSSSEEPEYDHSIGGTCLIMGWGILNPHSDTHSNTLMYAQQDILPMKDCHSKFIKSNIFLSNYGTSYLPNINVNICGTSPSETNKQDACNGDSGGPILCPLKNSIRPVKYVQYGITSWGLECASDTPGVYTKIAYYRDWIDHFADSKDDPIERLQYVEIK